MECYLLWALLYNFLPSHNQSSLHHFRLGNIRALIKEFKAFKLNKADAKNRSGAQDDRHYFGLAKLIIIGVRRMCTFCDKADASAGKTGSKKAAIGLLMALSLLHESLTPRDLFRLSPDKLREAWLQHQSRLGGWASSIKGASSGAHMVV